MQNQISFKQYRNIDLLLFTALTGVFEYILVTAAETWFPDQLYSLSLTALMSALVLMRWGFYAFLPMLAGGLAYSLASGGSAAAVLIYSAGNLMALLALLLFRRPGKARIASGSFRAAVFGFLVSTLMQLGRALIAFLLGNSFRTCLGFITTDLLSSLFAALVAGIAVHCDGLFEDQRAYLIRKQEEFREEKRQEQIF